MPALASMFDPGSPAAQANREAMLARIAELDELLATNRAGGGPEKLERHRKRGKLLARERIELLLDRDAPFLELQPFMAWHTDFHVGASNVVGIGVVEGVECVIGASDPTVTRRHEQPVHPDARRCARQEIALVNRLPLINLVESGGADLPTQADAFIPGGAIFRNLTRLSAHGIPTVALVFGNSTAGGAYMPGMSDYNVFVEGRAKVFLGGPPLVKMATGEESDDEELGGAEMHARRQRPERLPRRRRARRAAHRPRDRARSQLAQARPGSDGGAGRAGATTPRISSRSSRRTRRSRSTRARCSPACSTARATTSSSRSTARR